MDLIGRTLDLHNGGWKGLRKRQVGALRALSAPRHEEKTAGDNLRKASKHNGTPLQQDTVHIIYESGRIVSCKAEELETVISSVD